MEVLNWDLGLTKGQLRLAKEPLDQKTKEANEWCRKYRELSQQAEIIQDNKTKALIHEGKLNEADALLRR